MKSSLLETESLNNATLTEEDLDNALAGARKAFEKSDISLVQSRMLILALTELKSARLKALKEPLSTLDIENFAEACAREKPFPSKEQLILWFEHIAHAVNYRGFKKGQNEPRADS